MQIPPPPLAPAPSGSAARPLAARSARASPPIALLAVPLLAAACAMPAEMEHVKPGDPVGKGTLIVVNAGADSVSLMDALTGDRIIDLPLDTEPGEVTVSAGGATAVVACRGAGADGASLTVIDVAAAAVRRTIPLAPHGAPGAVRFLPDGRRVLVASGTTGHVLVVDTAAGRLVRAVPTGQTASLQLAVQPDGRRAWVSHGESGRVSVLDLERLAVLTTLQVGADADGLDITPDGEEVWVCNRLEDSLAVIDTATLAVIAQVPCSRWPSRVRFKPDGRRACVANVLSRDVAVFSRGPRRELARIALQLTPLEMGDSRLFGRALAPDVVVDVAPTHLLPSRDGRRLWVSHAQANIVSVLDLSRLDVAARVRAGHQPVGLGWTPLLPGQF